LLHSRLEGLVILLGVIVFFIAFIIHMPTSMQQLLFGKAFFQPVYSDTVASTSTLIGKGFPYLNYQVEAPPIIGLVHGLLVSASDRIGGSNPIVAYYLLLSWLILALYLTIIFEYSRLLVFYHSGRASWYDYFPILFPSFIVYLNYDFTTLTLATLLGGMLLITRDRLLPGYILLSLVMLMDPIGIFFIVYLLYQFAKLRTKTDLFGLLFSLIIVLGFLLGWLLAFPYSPSSLSAMFSDLFCKNCILLLSTLKPSSQYMAALGLSTIYAITALFLVLTDPHNRSETVLYGSLLYISTIVFGLNFIPQNMLYLLAIMPLIVLPVKHGKLLATLLVSDILNVSIILLWFYDSKIRSLLGLTPEYNPWSLSSPVQWAAQTRNLLLAVLLIIAYKEYFTFEVPRENNLISLQGNFSTRINGAGVA
jgi:hypothetical protein